MNFPTIFTSHARIQKAAAERLEKALIQSTRSKGGEVYRHDVWPNDTLVVWKGSRVERYEYIGPKLNPAE